MNLKNEPSIDSFLLRFYKPILTDNIDVKVGMTQNKQALIQGLGIHISSVCLCHLSSLYVPVFCTTFYVRVLPFFSHVNADQMKLIRFNGRQGKDHIDQYVFNTDMVYSGCTTIQDDI